MLKIKNISLFILATVLSLSAFAQPTLLPAKPEVTNYMQMLMVTVAILLVVVIWILTRVLLMVSKQALSLSKAGRKVMMIFVVVMGSMFTKKSFAQAADALADGSTIASSVDFYGGVSYNTFWTMSTVILLELLVIFLLVLFIKNIFRSIHPVEKIIVQGKLQSGSWMIRTWHRLDKQFFTKAIPLEKEADMLLDHDYDGIKELDNALPPWWKYGFYITIVVAVFYIFKFEVWHTGMNPTQEYAEEMSAAKIQTDAYLASAKENVDENSVVQLDAAGAAAGKEIFTKTCVACHLAEGQGSVGPNLTDEYWIHGGGVKDIFKTIKYGYPDKGMQSWQTTYSPVQMQQLATYIRTLKGTNPPNPKAPQGDLYKEVAVITDSAATTTINGTK
ncbi:MAG: c-type cytochrome [Chitinophagaceae bacterium]|jgi:cytochrome c oxidase cbb3-type subunit 3|nr:c-type cytochrome [Chitinophagaceae bacterium]